MKKLALWLTLICIPAGAQILSQIFFQSPASGSCGTPSATNLKAWYSADCMTAISPCATSYADGHGFTTNEHWQDRSGNANTLTIDFNELQCVFKVNKINGLPAVSFNADGGGNCGWLFGTQPDVGATSWAVFVAFQGTSTTTKGNILGPNTGANPPNTFKYNYADLLTTRRQQGVDKSQAALVGDGTALSDTNWHQMNVRFSNSADQNTLIFRLDRASDGTSTPGATIATNNGGIAEIGVDKTGGGYQEALNGRIAEILIYAGTGVIVSSGDVTTNETYLNCRYGL